MIIQCEQCRTKFRLDDEKVSDRGVKVRCAKCRHVFTVHKDGEQGAALVATVSGLTAAPVGTLNSTDEVVRMDMVLPVESVAPKFTAEKEEVPFDFGAAPVEAPVAVAPSFDLGQTDATSSTGFDFGDVSFNTGAPAAAPSDVDFGEMTMVMPPKKTTEPAADFSFDFDSAPVQQTSAADDTSFDFGEALSSRVDATAQSAQFDFGDQPTASMSAAADIDLGGFDFGEASAAVVAAPTGIENTDFSNFSSASVPKAAAGDGFSFDDAVPQTAAVSSGDSFDFSAVDFGAGQSTAAVSSAATEVDTFSMGEIDFSADTAAVKVDADAAVASGALFAPVEESVARQQAPAVPDITFDAPPAPEEAPPLSISSRRRQSSTLSMLIGVITVLVVGVLGYMGYTFISDGPKAVSLLDKGGVPADDGKIVVQNIKAYFIPKAVAGELLVITGDALNSHKKARAALQVKGMVFGANNQALATKTVYAGNPLGQEQLVSMTAEKIEAAMNNQFGDSLANLEVQPGKTISFTIVIINPPKEGKDFGVEPAGSTVAASK
jgi:predicted Zn finger-like uncharacterized protein